MSDQTLTSPDVAVGEIVQVAVQSGDGLRVIAVIGAAGGAGAVTSVTSTSPAITIAPATGAVIVSQDPSYPAVADWWPFDRLIPRTVAAPEMGQAAQIDATPPPVITLSASDAFAGSGNTGGSWTLRNGVTDGAGAPAHFTISQKRVPGPDARMIDAFYNPLTNVQSVGLGEATLGLAGTQLVLQGASNSVVSHAYIGMFSLDNATTGQAFIQMHDVDGSGTIPGAFNCQYDVFTAAAQRDAGLYLLRTEHTVGSGGSDFVQVQNAIAPGAAVDRYKVSELHATGGGTIAQAKVSIFDNNGATAQGKTSIAVPWADSSLGTGFQGIVLQRDSGNANDLGIIRRLLGNLYFGDQSDPGQLRVHANTSVFFELATFGTGGGWTFQDNGLGVQLQVSTDVHRTITTHGDVANGHDGFQTQKYGTNAGSTAGLTIASIDLPTGLGAFASITVTAKINAQDQVTGDSAGTKIASTFRISGGAAHLLAPADGPTDQGHDAAAAAFNASVHFTAPGGTVAAVVVDTWGANNIHFFTIVEMVVNTGVA